MLLLISSFGWMLLILACKMRFRYCFSLSSKPHPSSSSSDYLPLNCSHESYLSRKCSIFRDRSLSWVSLAPATLTIRVMDKWRSHERFLLLKLSILKRHLCFDIYLDTVLFDKILCLKEPLEAFFKNEWVFALIEDSFNEIFLLFNELEILELESCVSYY